MAKKRVYQLAKELNTTSKRLIEKLAEIKIEVKNHMSLIEGEQLEALYDHIGVIRHSEDKSGVADKKDSTEQKVIHHKPEARKNSKKAPRIIRTTEIYLDSQESNNEGGTNTDRNPKKGDRKRRSDFVKVATSTSGLRPGFVRESKPDFGERIKNEKKEIKKKDIAKLPANRDIKNQSTDKAPKSEEKNIAEGAKIAGVSPKGPESSKQTASSKTDIPATEKKALTASSQTNNEKAGKSSIPPAPKKDLISKDNKRVSTGNLPGGSGKKNLDNKGRAPKRDFSRTKTDIPVSKMGTAASTGQRQGNRSPHSKHLEIPKAELTPSQKDELNSQRIEREKREMTKDTQRDSRRGQRKDNSKPGGNMGKNKENKTMRNVLTSKKPVTGAQSNDFGLDGRLTDGGKKKRRPRRKREDKRVEKYIPPKAVLTSIKIPEVLTVKELAESLKKTAAEVIKKLMAMGIMATLNQEVDFETAAIISDEFGVKAEKEIIINEEDILFDDSDDINDPEAVQRPPVVVVMGHVDHGKTSLLDAIKKSNVTKSEAGGITQHIGAYTVSINDRNITFLDTPGHEAFTAMRARGAQVTDVAILVVAADDGVMPQTVEAINHAKAANVTIIVAINKIDKPGANPDKIKQALTEHGLVPEEWGGDLICVEVSAKQRSNIDHLLEMVLLVADMTELKANPKKQAKGTVIEARLDRDRGPTATLLVQRGTLKTGDSIITGTTVGRIRAMMDDRGRRIKTAGPSTPVEILGLPEVPEAGEIFHAITDERVAKHLVEKRRFQQREKHLNTNTRVSLEDLFNQIKEGKVKELNIIVKADVQGSVEAVKQSLEKLSNEEVRVNIIHGAVGAVTESDVTLALVSNAIIIGFNVRPAANVTDVAKESGVDLRLYRIIYDAIEDIQSAMKGMLDPTYKEVVLGHVEIRQIFKASGIGTIGGGYVTDGKIIRSSDIRLIRDGIVVYEGNLASLKRFKDDVREVLQGFECGLSIEKFNDIKEGDVVESYSMEEVRE